MDSTIRSRALEWTTDRYDSELREEILRLLDAGNEDELTDRFYKDLEFGTGGLRGKIGAGSNRMNRYTVGAATQGLSNYILQQGLQKKGVVISYDSRRKSKEFAQTTAAIFAQNGISAYIFDELTPTPLCSFAIRELTAAAGIMITASHNPPEYNGYKVFWSDGGQIIPPQDTEIIEEIRKIDAIDMISYGNYDEHCTNGMIITIGDTIRSEYYKKLKNSAFSEGIDSKIPIVYSPLHGTGYRIIPDLLQSFGFSHITVVSEQSEPDGNFPTVSYPNPEEKEAMALSIKKAQEENAELIMATDPDGDRIGVGIRAQDGSYVLLNGNQTAVLLTDYILGRRKKNGTLPADGKIVKTILTTELLAEIAENYSVECDNVLTGFKWIAAKMKDYEKNSSGTFLFGCEESFGYLPVDYIRDKDAVAAAYVICEMADYYAEQGETLFQKLHDIYHQYGMYLEDMHYIVLEGQEGSERIQRIMTNFREDPPEAVNNIQISSIRDYSNLTEIDTASGASHDIQGIPSSNVLQYIMDDGSRFTIRPSGTEPKIKFYISVKEKVTGSVSEAENTLKLKIDEIKKYINSKIDSVA